MSNKDKYKELNKRLDAVPEKVRKIYSKINLEASEIALLSEFWEQSEEMVFSDYPQLKKRVSAMKGNFVRQMSDYIYAGTSTEWANSNLAQDLLAEGILGVHTHTSNGKEYSHIYQKNNDALRAFQERKISKGGTLSQNLWKQSEEYVKEIESAISCAIEKGMSATTLSKKLSQYLNDYERLRADYTEKFGKALRAKDCEYRSIRLARSEMNIAYRTAEQTRWKQMDFIVGYEIKLSGSHHHRMPHGDICDELAGKYPKDFKWSGWHPNDICYVVPIIKTDDELWDVDDNRVSVNQVDDVPDAFKQWVVLNSGKIEKATTRNTLPYFVKDNRALVDEIILKHSLLTKPAEPFVMTEKMWKSLIEERGFYLKGDAEKYNNSAMKGFDIDDFDKKVSELMGGYGLKVDTRGIYINSNGRVGLTYGCFGENNSHLTLERTFSFGREGAEVEHDLFSVSDSLQGKGVSKAIFRELFKQYDAMGLRKVRLFANLEVGGYCWGKYGFSASKEEVMFLLRRRKELLSKAELADVEKIVSSCGEMVPMNLIADRAYGKKLLLGSDWDGVFDLMDAVQMEHLYKYIDLI